MTPNHQTIRVTFGPLPAALASLLGGDRSSALEGDAARTPLIDIHEGPEGLVLEADVPGVHESNLVVQLEDNVLTLRATVEANLPVGAKALHIEYHPTTYARSFILSEDVDRARITAELKQGVLTVRLPRTERLRTRRIEVKPS